MVTRTNLHEQVDALPDAVLEMASESLARLSEDKVLLALLIAPDDDEPVSEEEAALFDARWASAKRGNVVSQDEVRRLLVS